MDNTYLLLLQQLEQKKSQGKYWNISWNLGETLSWLVREVQPLRVLEVGTSNGFSALWILQFLHQEASFETVEVNKGRYLEAKSLFEQLPGDVIQHKGNIFHLLWSREISGKFDFIFVDAAQRFYLDLIQEFELGEFLETGCVLVFDNVSTHRNMDLFIDYMFYAYDCEILDVDSGFLIARKK